LINLFILYFLLWNCLISSRCGTSNRRVQNVPHSSLWLHPLYNRDSSCRTSSSSPTMVVQRCLLPCFWENPTTCFSVLPFSYTFYMHASFKPRKHHRKRWVKDTFFSSTWWKTDIGWGNKHTHDQTRTLFGLCRRFGSARMNITIHKSFFIL